MDPIESEPYEFLDLSDVNDSERNEIINTLTSEQTATATAQLSEGAESPQHLAAATATPTTTTLLQTSPRSLPIIHNTVKQTETEAAKAPSLLQLPPPPPPSRQQHQQQQLDDVNVPLNRNVHAIQTVAGATVCSTSNFINGFPPLPSPNHHRNSSSSISTKRLAATSSRKIANNNENCLRMSVPLPVPIPNLTAATAIESSLNIIDSNGNLVKVQHLPKAEKTQYGHVVRNLMLPRLIAPLSLPLYAVVKPTTAKLTELAVVPLRAPILTASAAVKSHVEQQAKVRVNVKSCGTSNLKTASASITMAQLTQPVHHKPPQNQQQSQPTQQQQQQQQVQQQQPPQSSSQHQQTTPPQQQQQQSQSSQQQQQVPPSQSSQQQQQIVSTSSSVVSQQNSNYVHHGPSAQPVYNQIHSYVPAHGIQSVGGPIYPTMIPAGMPPNVYVNNVTANVNLHGWPTHPAYIQGGPQHFIPGDVQPDQSNQVMQPMQPVAVQSSNPGRNARRGRGRNNNNSNRRNDYVQRQQQDLSPAPQDIVNAPQVDPQAIANAGYSQYAYQYTYPAYYGAPPQNHMVHPQTQQTTAPVYVASPIPVYPGHQIYNYQPGVIFPSMMHPADYQYDENDDQRSSDGMIPQMWHQPIFPDDYVNQEMIAPEDINHNAPSLASSETPSMLSPNYQMYDPQLQQTIELQQQMSVMHIYDEQQMQPHPGHMQQIEDDMSDCSLQMQGGALMQPMMQTIDQQHHHIMQSQGIAIETAALDQSTGSDHSLHEQHLQNNNNEVAIDAGVSEQCIDQQQQPQLLQQQPQPAINYHKAHHHPSPQQQQQQQPQQHLHQYAQNQMPNAVTKEAIRDPNQNVPNIPPQQNHSSTRNQQKDHYNSQIDEQHHQQQHHHNQQQPQHLPHQHHHHQQQQQQQQQQHQQQINHNQHQHQQYQHHRNNNQQQQQQQHQQHNPSVPTNNKNATVHNNDTSSAQQQQQQQQQQSSAPMYVIEPLSWMNSHTKKSTASVAVTATPTSNHKQYNHQLKYPSTYMSNNNNTNNTHHQPQVKNYGVMKTPSSPVATSHNNNDTMANLSPSQPHQQQQQQVNVPLERKYSGPSSATVVEQHKTSVSTTSIASTVVPQQFQQPPPPLPDSVKQTTIQSIKKTEILNLAPPITSNASATTNSSSQSWASLFVSANTTNFTTSLASSSSNTAPALPPPFSAKKPIAKVAPYEGITPVIPSSPVVTPGAMSYSAASAQGLPPPSSSVSAASQTSTKLKSSDSSSMPPTVRNANIDEWSFKFADFLTKYKTDFSAVSLRPRGLTNPSNYCYINSILQALMGCAPFYNLIKSIPKQYAALSSDVKTPTINAMLQLTAEFSTLPAGLRLNRPQKQPKGKDDMGSDLHCDSAFEPTAIYKLWNDSREEHVEGRQEDAEEFLGYVLNKLNDEMLEVIKLIAKPSVEQNGGDQTSENEEGAVWQMIRNNRNKGSVTRQTDFGRTPLSDIFRGELRSRLQREGEHSTDVIQPFFTLQLNIEKAASVKEALEILVGRDQLEGVTGSKSKQEVVAWQQMTLEKLPVVLILHLKWFDYKSDGCTKILKTVEFPVELKIDPKILASKKYSQKQRIYRLFAVVYHDGKEASKGHYITDVYHSGYSSWLRFDDSTVKPVSEHNVLRPRVPRVPYLLYYRRCDTMPNQPQTTTTLQTNANANKQ